MTHDQLHYFTKLTKFLGTALGPDYEVALHDMANNDGALVAIANNYISGRKLGDPLFDNAKKMVADRRYEIDDFAEHYYTMTQHGKVLRSSSMFIKDEYGQLAGILCINFDDNRFHDISQKIMELCHPDAYVEANFVFDKNRVPDKLSGDVKLSSTSSDITVATELKEVFKKYHLNPTRLTFDDKMLVVTELNSKGVFLIKNAVKDVAKAINSSPASVYRYLANLKEGK